MSYLEAVPGGLGEGRGHCQNREPALCKKLLQKGGRSHSATLVN